MLIICVQSLRHAFDSPWLLSVYDENWLPFLLIYTGQSAPGTAFRPFDVHAHTPSTSTTRPHTRPPASIRVTKITASPEPKYFPERPVSECGLLPAPSSLPSGCRRPHVTSCYVTCDMLGLAGQSPLTRRCSIHRGSPKNVSNGCITAGEQSRVTPDLRWCPGSWNHVTRPTTRRYKLGGVDHEKSRIRITYRRSW